MSYEKRPKEHTTKGSKPNASARNRVVKHLRTIMKTTATTGAVLGLSVCDACIVCDPMPEPFQCRDNMTTSSFWEWVSWTGQWADEGDDLVIQVEINFYDDSSEGDSLTFSDDPVLTGATLVSVERPGDDLVFTCIPDAGVGSVGIVVPVNCDGIAEQLVLEMGIAAEPVAGQRVTITTAE